MPTDDGCISGDWLGDDRLDAALSAAIGQKKAAELPKASRPESTNSAAVPCAVTEAHAANLRDITCGAYLYGSLAGMLAGIQHDAFVEYRHQLLKDCGNPTDPITVMLIEQLAMAHHAIGRLHVNSAIATNVVAATAYATTAARLLAEFRRGVLALDELRARAATRAGATDKFSSANDDHVNDQVEPASPMPPRPAEKKKAEHAKLERKAHNASKAA